MFRITLLALVLMAGLAGAHAQQNHFVGRWYLGFHDMVKVPRGAGCTFNINRTADGDYQLKYTGRDCKGDVPPEGRYTLTEGALVHDEWTLEQNHISITYIAHDVYTEFRPIATDSLVDKMIADAAKDIDRAVLKKPHNAALLRRSINTMSGALKIDSRCVDCIVNISIAWLNLDSLDSAARYYRLATAIHADNPHLPELKDAVCDHLQHYAWDKYGKKGLLKEAIRYYMLALETDPLSAEVHYNLGGAYFTLGDYKQARYYFTQTLRLKPDHEQAKAGLEAAEEKDK